MPSYLLCFAHSLWTFRIPEIQSLARMYGGEITYNKSDEHQVSSTDEAFSTPFLRVEATSEELMRKVASRAMLLKAAYCEWVSGADYEELKTKLIAMKTDDYVDNKCWKIEIDSFGRKYTTKEQVEIMNRLKGVNMFEKGKISLNKPDVTFYLLEDVGMPSKEQTQRAGKLRNLFFATKLCDGNRLAVYPYNLPDRPFLGTTSMDPELAMISANMAHAQKGTIVYDPFVGTGSIILSCSHFEAFTFGADIDIRTVLNPDKQIATNYAKHNLSQYLLGIVLADNSMPPYRQVPILDAIVGDPPYGIRAGARKVGKKAKPKYKAVPKDFKQEHFPQCIQYGVPEVLADLLALAARMLRVGGRLVYWLPTTVDYKDDDLPSHPCLKVVANSSQQMSRVWARRLITMEKTIAYDPVIHANPDASELGQINPSHAQLREKVFYNPQVHPKVSQASKMMEKLDVSPPPDPETEPK